MDDLLQLYAEVYDDIFRRASGIIEYYDPCEITDCGCIAEGKDFCCGGCSHLDEDGCTTQSIWCKMWLCYTAEKYTPECKKAMSKLKDTMRTHDKFHGSLGYIWYSLMGRKSKEEALNEVARMKDRHQQELLAELKNYKEARGNEKST